MKSIEDLSGSMRIRLTSADVSYSLKTLANSNITVWDVEMDSELSALVSISGMNLTKAKKVLKKTGASMEIQKQSGPGVLLSKFRKRLLLILGLITIAFLTIWLPTRIFFWEVSGNDKIPANFIIAKLQQEGVYFGCKRSEIRSEKLKNQLLEEIPQLEWVGVTTSGCVAKIWVSESGAINEKKNNEAFGNIVAICDGVVNSVTVTKGNPICKPGQAVQKGQVLISGYEDCGFLLKHSGADGEIYANTFRKIDGVSLSTGAKRTDLNSVSKKITIRIGKKLIKLSKDSGISYCTCVKMYSERCMILPGGFCLPVSLITETHYDYAKRSCSLSEDDFKWLSAETETYLLSHLLGGTIHAREFSIQSADEICQFRGVYSCTEQIGINKIEEIFSNGKNS